MAPDASRVVPEDLRPSTRTLTRARRHVEWARRDGLRRLVEEDNLDPRVRIAGAVRRWQWRRAHPLPPGSATAVLLVGVQRSGTNMVVRGFERSPEFEVHNENSRRVFDRFQLRDVATVRDVVHRSGHRFVLLKPLCDSHRVVELLDDPGLGASRKAIWAYRDVDARVRSAVTKFGDANRRVLAELARGEGRQRWQGQGLDEADFELLRSLDPAAMSPESAAALFWYLRNSFVLRLDLASRDDVVVVHYEQVVADPSDSMRTLATFLGCAYDDTLAHHIDARAARRTPLELDPRVRALCDDLGRQLEVAARTSRRRVTG